MKSNITSVFISSIWNSTVVTFYPIWYKWNPNKVPKATFNAKHVAAHIWHKNF